MEGVTRGVRLERVLGLEELVNRMKRGGWTGPQIREHVADLKRDNLPALDRFAGGELSRLRGRPGYPILLEATALRYAAHRTVEGPSLRVVGECPHGYRQSLCNRCLKEAG